MSLSLSLLLATRLFVTSERAG
ncbi:MAG: hypothetical protein QOE82_2689, partial [Thermoanaerobaculia bacterium]|nr:hypothetical protein [Thermoanaerobaculia bacterium]